MKILLKINGCSLISGGKIEPGKIMEDKKDNMTRIDIVNSVHCTHSIKFTKEEMDMIVEYWKNKK